MSHIARRLAILAAAGTVALASLACSAGGGGAARTPTATLTATGRCQSAVAGSTATAGSTAFADITFQPNATAALATTLGGGTGQFTTRTYTVCVPDVAPADVAAFYGAQLPAHGWATTPKAPYDGMLHQACTGACFDRDDHTRKVSVGAAHAGALSTVSFQLVIATPPPVPVAACRANEYSPSTPPYYSTEFGTDFPLPPLSTLTLGEGTPGGGPVFSRTCSAGTAASVTQFFDKYLPVMGWTLGSLPGSSLGNCGAGTVSGWVKGGKLLKLTIPDATPAYAVGFKWSAQLCGPPEPLA